jgi:hypothetical protein
MTNIDARKIKNPVTDQIIRNARKNPVFQLLRQKEIRKKSPLRRDAKNASSISQAKKPWRPERRNWNTSVRKVRAQVIMRNLRDML